MLNGSAGVLPFYPSFLLASLLLRLGGSGLSARTAV